MQIDQELQGLMAGLSDAEAAELLHTLSAPVDPDAEARIRARVSAMAAEDVALHDLCDAGARSRARAADTEPPEQVTVPKIRRLRIFYSAAAACLILCISAVAVFLLKNRPDLPVVLPDSQTVTETLTSSQGTDASGPELTTDTDAAKGTGAPASGSMQTGSTAPTESAVTAQTAPTETQPTQQSSVTEEPVQTESAVQSSATAATTLTSQSTAAVQSSSVSTASTVTGVNNSSPQSSTQTSKTDAEKQFGTKPQKTDEVEGGIAPPPGGLESGDVPAEDPWLGEETTTTTSAPHPTYRTEPVRG